MDDPRAKQLTERAAEGDRSALEELLEGHFGALHAYLRASAGPRLRAAEEIEDLAQSVCREVLEHADRFRHAREGAFRRWLFQEARRKLLSRRRYHEAGNRDAAQVELGSDPGALEHLLAAYQSFTSPSAGIAAAEEVARVEAALDDLPEDQRRVILLAHLGQWSRRDIGEELGKSEGAVRMLLHRAVAALAVRLAE